MTVHFIGAGPGAADLITLRGRDLIARSPVCLYAGSLVPKELLAYCPKDARIIDTAPLSLEEIVAELSSARKRKAKTSRGCITVISSPVGARWVNNGANSIVLRLPTPSRPVSRAFAAAAAALET